MKTNKFFAVMATAVLTIGGTTMTSCHSETNDFVDKHIEESQDTKAAKADVTYFVDLGANTLELADVEVIYLDENKKEKSFKMTQNQWTLKRTLTGKQMPSDFSLKVVFTKKDVTPVSDKDYEFGCVARIPFTVYNSKGKKICEHPGVVSETNGKHPSMKGSAMNAWWFSYELGFNPDKLINFDKKTLTIRDDRGVFNDMSYKYSISK